MPMKKIEAIIQPFKLEEVKAALKAIAIEGMKPVDVANTLHSKHRIHTVAIDWENVHCVRITPHVYTSTKDLDRLVIAIRQMAT